MLLHRAVVKGRLEAHDEALATLDRIDRLGGLGPAELLEKGRLLDKMGRFDEAFGAFHQGKALAVSQSGEVYMAEQAEALAARSKAFFTAGRLAMLPRAGVVESGPKPLFIVGFPRSGATVVEQTLSAHPKISAADELPFISEIAGLMPRMLNSPLSYPEALADLWMGDKREVLDNLRDYYLQKARQAGAIEKEAVYFTDKTPLNETYLGLIALMFPDAPILHVLRHPLDVVLSAYSNKFSHGFNCGAQLETIARHYVLIADLIEHYRCEMPLRYMVVRYEDFVQQQEDSVQRMLAFIDLPFDRRCLQVHENRRSARTASCAQLYDSACYRHAHYRSHLGPVIPLLEPVIRRLGYTL